ncbi:MAG TPA: DUF3574 domain-containing protein [Longimicrobium sp.]|nr:DUF3574 domain-containing protein [Longimicrobium sp.]
MMPRRLAPSLLVLVLAGCAPAVATAPTATVRAAGEQAWVSDRLFFGRDIPGGGSVSEEAWAAFLAEVVTPRFPEGLTVLRGEGQWRGANGAVVREPSFVVEITHPPSARVDAALDEIAAEYRRRFRQEAVMRVRTRAEVKFHE